MADLRPATPHVKKNLLLIRLLLGLVLGLFALFHALDHPEDPKAPLLYGAALLATFVPFFFLEENTFRKVHFQYIVFSMDLLLVLMGLYLFDHFQTNLLITLFLTFFISALSQSVGRSLVVALAVVGLYLYLAWARTGELAYQDPFLLLSCALLLGVSVHSGYLAFRTVEEEKEILVLARKAALLSEKVREGDEAALQYAATLRNVLDTLPIGALAVSTEGNILFVNAKVGKLLDLNPRALMGGFLGQKSSPLGPFAEYMVRSLKERRELKREYVEVAWKGRKRRFRLDSSAGMSPTGRVWGTLFVLQESFPSDPGRTGSPDPDR